jgi:hypothetical protein
VQHPTIAPAPIAHRSAAQKLHVIHARRGLNAQVKNLSLLFAQCNPAPTHWCEKAAHNMHQYTTLDGQLGIHVNDVRLEAAKQALEGVLDGLRSTRGIPPHRLESRVMCATACHVPALQQLFSPTVQAGLMFVEGAKRKL